MGCVFFLFFRFFRTPLLTPHPQSSYAAHSGWLMKVRDGQILRRFFSMSHGELQYARNAFKHIRGHAKNVVKGKSGEVEGAERSKIKDDVNLGECSDTHTTSALFVFDLSVDAMRCKPFVSTTKPLP